MRNVLDEVLADLKHISVGEQPAVAVASLVFAQTHSIRRARKELSV